MSTIGDSTFPNLSLPFYAAAGVAGAAALITGLAGLYIWRNRAAVMETPAKIITISNPTQVTTESGPLQEARRLYPEYNIDRLFAVDEKGANAIALTALNGDWEVVEYLTSLHNPLKKGKFFEQSNKPWHLAGDMIKIAIGQAISYTIKEDKNNTTTERLEKLSLQGSNSGGYAYESGYIHALRFATHRSDIDAIEKLLKKYQPKERELDIIYAAKVEMIDEPEIYQFLSKYFEVRVVSALGIASSKGALEILKAFQKYSIKMDREHPVSFKYPVLFPEETYDLRFTGENYNVVINMATLHGHLHILEWIISISSGYQEVIFLSPCIHYHFECLANLVNSNIITLSPVDIERFSARHLNKSYSAEQKAQLKLLVEALKTKGHNVDDLLAWLNRS